MNKNNFKYKIGDIVLNERVIVDRYVGLNIYGKVTNMYKYRYKTEPKDIKPLICSEETIIRRNYK